MTGQPTIRVFLGDDHAVVRRGMRAFLDMLSGIEVIGEAADGQAALDELAVLDKADNLPDVVPIDLLMPRLDGVAALGSGYVERLYGLSLSGADDRPAASSRACGSP
jgi:DNA-binding NarL/FixJ family response regulator